MFKKGRILFKLRFAEQISSNSFTCGWKGIGPAGTIIIGYILLKLRFRSMDERCCLASMVKNRRILLKLRLTELISSKSVTGGLMSIGCERILAELISSNSFTSGRKNRIILFFRSQLHTPDVCLLFVPKLHHMTNFMFF